CRHRHRHRWHDGGGERRPDRAARAGHELRGAGRRDHDADQAARSAARHRRPRAHVRDDADDAGSHVPGDRSGVPGGARMPVTGWRVALLITELHPGGAERVVYDLATRLHPRFDPFVVALWSPHGMDGTVATALKLSGVPVFPLRVRGKSDVTRLAPLVRL